MKLILASDLIHTMVDLNALEKAAETIHMRWNEGELRDDLLQLRRQLNLLELKTAVMATDRLIEALEDGYTKSNQAFEKRSILGQWLFGRTFEGDKHELGRRAAHLKRTITDELSQMVVVAINPSYQDYLSNKTQVFGAEVELKMPDAVDDLQEAVKCFALERYTACACHLMRALELGVRLLGAKLRVSVVEPDGRMCTWGQITTRIDQAVQKLPHDQFGGKFRAILVMLNAVRTAWRNETMHPNKKYDENEAGQVLNGTKGFLQLLVSVL